MRRPVSMIVIGVALCSVTAMAEVKTQIIPASQAESLVAPDGTIKPLKLTMNDATAAEIVAAFNKMAGINIRLDEGGQANAGVPVLFDVAIDAPNLPAALNQLAQTLHVGIFGNGDAYHAQSNAPEGYQNPSGGQQASEPASVRVNGVAVNRTLNGAGEHGGTLSVTMTQFSGPQGAVGKRRVKLISAIDDQGRSLAAINQEDGTAPRQRIRNAVGFSLPLTVLDPPSKRIASFNAEVSFDVPKTFKRLIITDFPDTAVDVDVMDLKMKIGPLTKEGDSWLMKISYAMPSDPVRRIEIMNELPSIRVVGPSGEPLRLQHQGGMSDGTRAEATMRVLPDKIRPAVFMWDVLEELETITLTVEAVDLQIP